MGFMSFGNISAIKKKNFVTGCFNQLERNRKINFWEKKLSIS